MPKKKQPPADTLSKPSETDKPPERGSDGRFMKGHSVRQPAGLAGRLARLQEYIDTATLDGRITAKVVIDIATNEKARHADRLRAVEMLWDRTMGKALDIQATIAVGQGNGGTQSTLAADILESLIRSLPAPADAKVIEGESVSHTDSHAPDTQAGIQHAQDPDKSDG